MLELSMVEDISGGESWGESWGGEKMVQIQGSPTRGPLSQHVTSTPQRFVLRVF